MLQRLLVPCPQANDRSQSKQEWPFASMDAYWVAREQQVCTCRSGSIAIKLGVEAGPQMSPECAVCKMMQCLRYPDLPLTVPLAGEM